MGSCPLIRISLPRQLDYGSRSVPVPIILPCAFRMTLSVITRSRASKRQLEAKDGINAGRHEHQERSRRRVPP